MPSEPPSPRLRRAGTDSSRLRRGIRGYDFSWSGEADLDRRIGLLRIHDYGLVRLHIHEPVFDLLVRFQGKFLVLSHFEFPMPAPGINERGHGLWRGGDLSLHQRNLYVTLLVFEEQLRNICIDAVLIPRVFLRELDDLELSAADNVADLQELRRLALVDRVNAKSVSAQR